MNIELKRIRHKPYTIDGHIYIDGEKICDCAENANHALPLGTYAIALIKSKTYGRKMPVVISHSVSDSHSTHPDGKPSLSPSLIANHSSLIAIGNGVYNRTDGSILVGTYIVPGILRHSKPSFDALYDRIRKNLERNNPVQLTITSIKNLYRL